MIVYNHPGMSHALTFKIKYRIVEHFVCQYCVINIPVVCDGLINITKDFNFDTTRLYRS